MDWRGRQRSATAGTVRLARASSAKRWEASWQSLDSRPQRERDGGGCSSCMYAAVTCRGFVCRLPSRGGRRALGSACAGGRDVASRVVEDSTGPQRARAARATVTLKNQRLRPASGQALSGGAAANPRPDRDAAPAAMTAPSVRNVRIDCPSAGSDSQLPTRSERSPRGPAPRNPLGKRARKWVGPTRQRLAFATRSASPVASPIAPNALGDGRSSRRPRGRRHRCAKAAGVGPRRQRESVGVIEQMRQARGRLPRRPPPRQGDLRAAASRKKRPAMSRCRTPGARCPGAPSPRGDAARSRDGRRDKVIDVACARTPWPTADASRALAPTRRARRRQPVRVARASATSP